MFHICPKEKELIDAAIQLAEWFTKQPELRPEDRDRVRTLIDGLNALPKITEGLNAEIEFGYCDQSVKDFEDITDKAIDKDQIPIGSSGVWAVGFYKINKGPTKGETVLEIFNNKFTYPQCFYDELYDTSQEYEFFRSSTDSESNRYSDYKLCPFELARMYDWINVANHVETYKKHRDNFELIVS